MRLKLLVLILFFFSPKVLLAQTIFQNLRWQDGLSAKQVRCLYKDDEGFLWIGTSNGLNRFDGAVIKQYKSGNHLRSLYINAIQPIVGNDTLLIGSRTGLMLFDKKTGAFTDDPRFAVLKNEVIETIRADNRSRIWIATAGSSKIFIYENHRLLPISKVIPAAAIMEKPGFAVAEMVWDTTRNGFWIAGSMPYFIDCKNNKVYHKGNNPFRSPVLDIPNVHAIAVDRKGNVWFANNNAEISLNFWDAARGTVEILRELDGIKINEGCNRLFIDHSNRLWISTWLFAAFIKEPGKPIKKLSFGQTQAYTIAYGFFRDVVEDSEGTVWLGTINGVSKSQSKYPLQAIYQLPSFSFFLETGFAHANHISIDNGSIMASKEDGFIEYKMSDRTYKRYFDPNKKRNRYLMSAKTGNTWWLASEDGLFSLEKGSDKLVEFKHIRQGLLKKHVNFVFADKRGEVWFHVLEDALYRYDPVTNKTDRFDGKDSVYGKYNFLNCQSFLEVKNGNLFFAMNGAGLLKFDRKTNQFSIITVPEPFDFYVSQMAEDPSGNIWSTPAGRGIFKMDSKGVLIDSIDTSKGLIYDHISGLGIDVRGMVWASSREGLMFFSPVTKAVTKVEIDLGKTIQDYWNNLTIADGRVYAIMLDHVVDIDPLRFLVIPVRRPPHLTSVKLFGLERAIFEDNGEMVLEPDEDDVTIQYASLSHRDVPSLQYSFQLEGIDKDWVLAGRSLTASYTNLTHGDYVFKVRSTDENGNWMTAETTLNIHVKPEWWQTWWFRLFCILLVMLSILWLDRNLRIRKRKSQIDKTIDYFANSVYGENSVNEICWDIARNCISQLHFEDCMVYLMDHEKNKLVQKAAYGPKNPRGHEITYPSEIEIGEGVVGIVFSTGKSLVIGDTTKDSRYIPDGESRFSELAVPILHEGKVIGVIDSEHSQKNFFNDDHAKAITIIASISANKIAEAIAEAEAQEKEIMLLEISKMLAESQLMALRAQMNPHFIFNCLNSIQECIVTQKYGEATKYLNKFSRLFRMVLNNSDRTLVAVEEEKEVLELYLELEQMRFEKNFSFEILMDEDLEDDQVLIPSMLVQPYVENAIWHGLMHKSGERKLVIEFSRISEELFKCRIEDNGIGRQKSFDLKIQNSKSKQHVSKGLRISKDRLDLLQRQGNQASLKITDKYDTNGLASGTLIEIELSAFLHN